MSPTTGRVRNRRGEGDLLRNEIVSAAERLVAQAGGDETLTLRAIAREAGISAPSIYAHFDDLAAVRDALLDAGFDRLSQSIDDSMRTLGATTDPVRRLLAGCRAYVDFAMREPAAYRLLFNRGRPSGEVPPPDQVPPAPLPDQVPPAPLPAQAPPPSDPSSPGLDQIPPTERHHLDAFRMLIDGVSNCVTAGRSTSTDPVADATALWTALHGAVSLRQHLPKFPWPPLHDAADRFAVELAHLTPA
ncbi:TetR/AcrR family transcriptional regulator [Micromonospora sp. NPDC050417]|uniref:TetR/AcrR family transcriptional regulator n=1 Tax=Micromonospora sp. NPDC050417 TaxID=3364280 RepID=UPI003799EE56